MQTIVTIEDLLMNEKFMEEVYWAVDNAIEMSWMYYEYLPLWDMHELHDIIWECVI